MLANNIYENIPNHIQNEFCEIICHAEHVRIERIVSRGHSSEEGFWYDQEQSEWVILLKGHAKLLFEGIVEPINLQVGDYLNIPSHVKHRVDWTDPDQESVWLAVHY